MDMLMIEYVVILWMVNDVFVWMFYVGWWWCVIDILIWLWYLSWIVLFDEFYCGFYGWCF